MARNGKRVSERVQNAVDVMFGNVAEPHWTAMNSDKINMIQGLNYYANYSEPAKSKLWALDWIKKRDVKLHDEVKGQKDTYFSNRGYVCRMEQRGFVLDERITESLLAFFRKMPRIDRSSSLDPVVVPERKVVKRPQVETNKALEVFDEELDKVLSGEVVTTITMGTNAKELREVKILVEKSLSDVEQYPEEHNPKVARALKRFYKMVIATCGNVVEAVKESKKKVAVPTKIIPVKMVEKLRYQKESPEFGLKSIPPAKIISARKVVIYDTLRRMISILESVDASGFLVTGTTIKNINEEKSKCKRVRKPEVICDLLAKADKIADYETIFDSLTTTRVAANGRTNENTIILYAR